MLTIERSDSDIFVIRASGKLSKSDYETFVPAFERVTAEHGPIRILIELEDFEGWELPALWEDLKFDMSHQDDIGRLALVGDRTWQEWGTRLSKPFFRAEMRFFRPEQRAEARSWLAQS